MKAAISGGGPAGLYFAIQILRRDPSHDISVIERNPPGSTFGWGVVFSGGKCVLQSKGVIALTSAPNLRLVTVGLFSP
jgi:2-polyprenyl-6-methoxyphenol hydroxylase-like FAD-dependent oxidoreductase